MVAVASRLPLAGCTLPCAVRTIVPPASQLNSCIMAFPLSCGHGLGTDVRTQRFTWHECHFEFFSLVVSDAIVSHTYVYRAGFNGLRFGESHCQNRGVLVYWTL